MRTVDIFDAALVALGPPAKVPTASGKGSISSGFAEKVQEYNTFVGEAGYVVLPEYSYIEYSRWFHNSKKPFDTHAMGKVGSPYEPAPQTR